MTIMLASLIGLAGLVGVSYGIWLVFEPAGYMSAGLCLLFISWRLS